MASYAITHGNARRARRAGSPTVNGTIQAARTYAVDFVLRATIGSVRPWPKTGVVLIDEPADERIQIRYPCPEALPPAAYPELADEIGWTE